MERREACKNLVCLLSGMFLGFGVSKKKSFGINPWGRAMQKAYNGNTLEEQVGKCYAKQVVHPGTEFVINAENALGKIDEKYAEIMPNGELTLKMENPFSVMISYDSSVVVCKGGDYSVAALIPTEIEETHGKNEVTKYTWRDVIPGIIPGGFKVPQSGQVMVDTIKIKNNGKNIVYVDAIIGSCDASEK